MSKRNVKPVVEMTKPYTFTAKQKAEMGVFKAVAANEIDTSEIPPLTDAFWKKAVRNPFYKPTKTPTTVRIDSDVLVWLKAQGKGYQSRINAILRREMLASLKR